jgi:hypothetical protein
MQENQTNTLSYKKIFVFWYPLAATWLMMALESPFLTAIIARLAEPKYNLAAFGVAFSFALIIEAPIIMIMSASTALVKNRDAFYKLRRFTYSLNIIITLILLIILLPPVFYYIAMELIGLPENVAKLTHVASILLIPWPAAIGYRRFYQGVMIRSGLTRRVAYGTVVRLVTMAITALVLFLLKIKGAYVGAAALSMGVVLEAITGRLMAAGAVNHIMAEGNPGETENNEKPLTYRFIFKFYYPLALTTILSLGVHPFVTFFVGKSRFALESLAVLPVINALAFIFRSLGLSYTEVAVALLGKNNKHYILLRNFAWFLGIAVVGILTIIAFTPLVTLWFSKVSGLSPALTEFSVLPTRLIALLPGLTVFIALQRAVLVNSQATGPITRATILEVAVIIGTLLIATRYLDIVGAVAATCAYTLGRLCANTILLRPQIRAAKGA